MKEKQYGAAGLSCDLVRGALRGWQTLAGGTRRIAARGAKADKPKRYEPINRVQDCKLSCQTFVLRCRRWREAIVCAGGAVRACPADSAPQAVESAS